MQRPTLPADAKIDWDHILLVASYSESGELLSTFYSVDPSFPKVDVVVSDAVMGSTLVRQDNKMIPIPSEITELDAKLKFAKDQNGTLANGFYIEEGVERRLSDHIIRLRRIQESEMGIFSFISVDTNESIVSKIFLLPEDQQMVKMAYKDLEGNIHVAIENEYEGYGVFGGIDIFEAIAWMNDLQIDSYEDNRSRFLKTIPRQPRDSGIDFLYDESANGEYPQLFLGELPPLETISFNNKPKGCPTQGGLVEVE